MEQLIKPQNLTLSREQLSMLMPYLLVSVGAMVALLAGVFLGSKGRIAALLVSLVTVGAAIFAVSSVWGEPAMTLFNGMMLVDYYSGIFNVLLLGATGLMLITAYPYLEKEGLNLIEFYSLALFACLGMMLLAAALDLVVLFIALETMSLAVYVMVGFRRTDVKSNEAAMKYFILGGAASAILLFGVALVYGATGTMNIMQLTEALRIDTRNPLLLAGAVLVLVGFLFKVASAPFHMWMPDVYEGAPTVVTNFMTTGLKAAAFAAFLRVFLGMVGSTPGTVLGMNFHDILWACAVLTMFFGNVIALAQKNIKRMLAYSSIAHTGYLLVAFIAGGRSEYGFSSIVVYLFAYVIMNLGAFTVVALLGEKGDQKTNLEDYAGLSQRSPWLAFAMTVFMFSMAGIPPTVGFAGKYMIFISAVQAKEIPLAIIAVLCSAISAYYYLRVIVYMYMRDPTREGRVGLAFGEGLVIILAALATLQFGVFPSMLIHAARKAASL